MNVLFVYQDDKMPSSRIRVLNLLPEIQKSGIFAEALVCPKNISEKISLFKKIRRFDVVFLQKKLLSAIEANLFKIFSGKLIFDFDDAIYYRDDSHPSFKSKSRYFNFKNIVRKAELVVAGNRILSDYAKQFNEHVVIVPSAVETRNIPVKNSGTDNDKIIIGWIGGKGNLRHLEMLSDTFQKLAKKYEIQVSIICNDSIEIPGVKTNFIPWKLETQGKEIAQFDIGVMPLPDNKWTQGKCGYKALQYMAAAVPPVVSNVGANKDIVEHGKEGFVVSSLDDFYLAIETLIKNKELRNEMGLNARHKVENQFSVCVVAKQLADILRSL